MDFEAPARVSKNPNLGVDFLGFGIFETRAGAGFLDFEAPARVSKNPKLGLGFLEFWNFGNSSGSWIFGFWSSRSSFQKSKPWGGFFGILEFRKLERDLDFWILRLPLEFPKIRNLGWNFWIFGILETGVLVRFFQGFYTVQGLGFRVLCVGFRV